MTKRGPRANKAVFTIDDVSLSHLSNLRSTTALCQSDSQNSRGALGLKRKAGVNINLSEI